MTTKTPQEIAFALLGTDAPQFVPYGTLSGVLDLHALIREAIEADRAQRAADLAILADAAASWSAELTDYVIPAADEAEAVELEAQRDRITAALGRYLDETEEGRGRV